MPAGNDPRARKDTSGIILRPRRYSAVHKTSPQPGRTSDVQKVRLSELKHLSDEGASNTIHENGQRDDSSAPMSRSSRQTHSRHSIAGMDAMISVVVAQENRRSRKSLPTLGWPPKPEPPSFLPTRSYPSIKQRQLMRPLEPPIPSSRRLLSLDGADRTARLGLVAAEKVKNPASTESKTIDVQIRDVSVDDGKMRNSAEKPDLIVKEVDARRSGARDALHQQEPCWSAASIHLKCSPSLPTHEHFALTLKRDGFVLPHGSSHSRQRATNTETQLGCQEADSTELPSAQREMDKVATQEADQDLKLVSPFEPQPYIIMIGSFKSDAPQQVYFHVSLQYWLGRFSSICDRLRTEECSMGTPDTSLGAEQKNHQKPPKQIFQCDDSFEVGEEGRSRKAFEELRHCCQTEEAHRSFQEFHQKMRPSTVTTRQVRHSFYGQLAQSKAGNWPSQLDPQELRKNVAVVPTTMQSIQGKMKPRSSFPRSNTTGDLKNTGDSAVNGARNVVAKIGWHRPSYLKAEKRIVTKESSFGGRQKEIAKVDPCKSSLGRTENAPILSEQDAIGAEADPRTTYNLPAATGTTKTMTPLALHHTLSKDGRVSTGLATSNAEVFKKVFSDSVRGMKKMGRTFTGTSTSEGH